ncbi:hypothetical protein [Thauera linaloolentis]|uniref:Uncharacterized protein n=1 Tax=Thauera linaloolentis (strain DSM 12138 / JCM 21573 / CCUG 41526 / CIP 105981 / IAM 15112 / NBRC 102519 / 47Lol) TaxID=1123367 RepID=N6Y0R2_THAL4|nr:hypothetical protein [Thauera linaloolentis]ENO87736.1 hypothetical protein C666_10365 [Thauera linaloolentis 47Lol = DSM 12138]MCM8567602.1 hypothetical protein [Thauera linaloolentis]
MITRQTIATLITTTALAYAICTPAQAASLLPIVEIDVPSNCSGDKHDTSGTGDKGSKPVQS